MNYMLIPPREPQQNPVRLPMVYVGKPVKWEYKQIVRNLESEQPLDENELNALGEEGWDLSGIAQQPPLAYFYFKRQVEK
ncbi:MAG TPA: hypothetical protein VFG81_01805 [Anaerolineales bacterium]|jgi:hypothetical protein|nr:hypothetical protein [Anaerolineales bacterium]